jgi:hypothetical protein
MILSIDHQGSVSPDWPTGTALGVGGLAGAYAGQSGFSSVYLTR